MSNIESIIERIEGMLNDRDRLVWAHPHIFISDLKDLASETKRLLTAEADRRTCEGINKGTGAQPVNCQPFEKGSK